MLCRNNREIWILCDWLETFIIELQNGEFIDNTKKSTATMDDTEFSAVEKVEMMICNKYWTELLHAYTDLSDRKTFIHYFLTKIKLSYVH